MFGLCSVIIQRATHLAVIGCRSNGGTANLAAKLADRLANH